MVDHRQPLSDCAAWVWTLNGFFDATEQFTQHFFKHLIFYSELHILRVCHAATGAIPPLVNQRKKGAQKHAISPSYRRSVYAPTLAVAHLTVLAEVARRGMSPALGPLLRETCLPRSQKVWLPTFHT